MAAISVIVPVYNGEAYIESCLRTIRKQTLKDLEIIFVDDGSTDHTLEYLRKYEADDIKVFTQENAGAGGARNHALKYATGEFVIFLDVDDCWADCDTLKQLYEKAKANDALICGGAMINLEKPSESADKYAFRQEGFVSFADYQFDFGFTRFIFSRRLLEEHQIRFPAYRIYEDPVFLTRAMIAAQRFYAVPEVVYLCSGSHQTVLNASKTVDYLHGLTDNLHLSARHGYARLHRILFDRLTTTASYYAECNLRDGGDPLHRALIDANAAIDIPLLQQTGLEIVETYVIPALCTVWRASANYLRLRRSLDPRHWLHHFRRN